MAGDNRITEQEPMLGGTGFGLNLDGHWAFVVLPTNATGKPPRRWLWYAPTLRGAHPAAENDFYATRAIEAGMAFAGIDVGESYGSPAGTALLERFYREVTAEFDLSPKAVLLPQSRGGLMLYNWASRHPECVDRIAGIFPVCDVRSWPGVRIAASAFEMTESRFLAELHRYNPIDLLEPLAKAKVPILHISGDRDRLVPIEANSAELARRYQALDGRMELITIAGKGHEVADELFRSEPFAEWVINGLSS